MDCADTPLDRGKTGNVSTSSGSASGGLGNGFLGALAALASGIAYGFNPLFAKPLLSEGVSVYSMLFFRYIIAAGILLVWLLIERSSLKVSLRQLGWLCIMGLLFAASSITLFLSYNYIPAGFATTLIYIYPAFTAIILLFMGKKPSWQTWAALAVTLAGVVLMCMPTRGVLLNITGIICAISSALVYAIYLILINNNNTVKDIPPKVITLYCLVFGSLLFFGLQIGDSFHAVHEGGEHLGICNNALTQGINGWSGWLNIIGLAIFPTMVSLLCLTVATRLIGATPTAILGVAEPFTAIIIGIVLFGERFTTNILIGMILCIAAIVSMIAARK